MCIRDRAGTDEYCAKCEADKCTLCFASYINEGACTKIETELEECHAYKGAAECQVCGPSHRLNDKVCSKLNLTSCLYSTDDVTCDLCDGMRSEDDAKLCTGNACSAIGCMSCKWNLVMKFVKHVRLNMF